MRTTWMEPGSWRGRLAAGIAALLLTACGGGGGGTADSGAASGAATIGASGGSVVEASGARVDVPANSLAADTTIRIAQDSTGAPGLPAGLTAAGSIYALTPHGTSFAQPVMVKIPAPRVALQPNETLRLAKAEVGGTWQLIDSTEAGGMLSAEVSDFSYFLPVKVSYSMPVLTAQPWAVEEATIVSCGPMDCNRAFGQVQLTVAVRTSGTQLPDVCVPGSGEVIVQALVVAEPAIVEATGGGNYIARRTEWQRLAGLNASGPITTVAAVACRAQDGSRFTFHRRSASTGQWVSVVYPAVALMPLPEKTQVVAGVPARIEVAMLGGGGSSLGRVSTPTPELGATVDWERSDDAGRSWRVVARSYQYEGDPNPFGEALAPWLYTGIGHGMLAAASDNGALFRARACFIPPDAPPPPCATSNSTQLVVLQSGGLPVITVPPASTLVRSGQTASFSATAVGLPAPVLQWQSRAAGSSSDWANIAGATAASYTTPLLSLADNGRQYRIVATNVAGTAESAPVTVSVAENDVAPSITTQPANLSVAAGGDAVFAIAARGTEALSYQWRFNGAAITGANAPVLRLSAVTNAQAGRYSVAVSNAAGSVTSDEATLDVTSGVPAAQAPSIVTQPVSVLTHVGNTATFGVGAAGTGPLAYQWLKAGQPMAGATAATYSVASATLADAGSYAVRVSNAVGSVTSWNVVLTVNEAVQPQVPAIGTQPSPQVQLPGGSATLAVAASGSAPMSYQWLKNGTPIPGATGAVLTLAGVTGSDVASYAVVVTNPIGSVTSSGAALTVLGAPAIAAQPASQSVLAGASARFSVTATGSALGYQWTRNGVAIAGANASSYTTPATTLADSGSVYGVVVYNGAGIVFSDGAVLTVEAATVASADGKISAQLNHTCAVRESGSLYCWGNGANGELGNGSAEYSAVPVAVVGLTEVTEVSAGGSSTCAIHGSARTLSCWGTINDSLQPRPVFTEAIPVRAVALGLNHACLINAFGGADEVACWGANDFGQIGTGNTAAESRPTTVRRADGSALTGAVAVAVGDSFSCAQLAGGEVWCWGSDIAFNARPVPQRVQRVLPGGARMDFTATGRLVAGLHHACAIESSSGQPLCWGFNPDGQLGDATTISRDLAAPAGLFGAIRLVAGARHICAIRANDVFCWGTGYFGNGGGVQTLLSPENASARVAAFTDSPNPAIAGAAGERHSCVLRRNGDVQCWGWNNAGQIGNDAVTVDALTPASTAAGAVFWAP